MGNALELQGSLMDPPDSRVEEKFVPAMASSEPLAPLEERASARSSFDSPYQPLYTSLTDMAPELLQLIGQVCLDFSPAILAALSSTCYYVRSGLLPVVARIQSDKLLSGTALMHACENGYHAFARVLLEAKANVDHTHDDGWTCLMKACLKGHDQVVLALLEKGAAVDAAKNNGSTSLMLACNNGHEQCVRALLEAGANIEAVQNQDCTALMASAQNGHEQCARALLEAGALVDAANNKGVTSLIKACANGHEQVARALIEAKADLEKQNNEGMTALLWACTARGRS